MCIRDRYNAALMSGLEIQEVHNHTYPSHYVSKGRDAAVDVYKRQLIYGITLLPFMRPIFDIPLELSLIHI